MASARAASLAENRRRYASRRVMRPSSLGSKANTIQRQVITQELKSQYVRYEAGLISNEDFLSYLQNIQTNPALTPSEVVNIEETILGFEQEVQGEQLEAAFKNAPEGSEEKIDAAATLAAFYQSVASQQIEGTPAHSRTLQKMSQWMGTAENELVKSQNMQRKLARAQTMFELSQFEPNTVEMAQQKAQALQELALMAQEDGDQQEFLQLMTQANNEINKIPVIEAREQSKLESANRKERLDYFRNVKDLYHDGQINAQEAAQAVNALNDAALEANDTAMLNSINSFTDSLQRDIETGVERGTVEGLNYAIRRGDKTVNVGIADLENIFRTEDDVFKSEMRQIEKIPNAVERLEKTLQLTAAYLYGAQGDENDPDGWIGLENRTQLYGQWAELLPKKSATYENKARDNQTKVDNLLPKLAQVAAQFDALGVDTETSQAVLGSVLNALPPELTPDPLTPRSYGVLVETDNFGRQFERVIPLGTTTVITDPNTGLQSTINTKVGADIASIQDPQTGEIKYVKLSPYFSNPELATGSPYDADFLYGEYNGEIYVKEPFTQELKKAKELAKTNELVNSFYQNKTAEILDRKRIAVENARRQVPTGPLSPELERMAQELNVELPVQGPPTPTPVAPRPEKVGPVSEVMPPEVNNFQAPAQAFEFKPDVSQDLRLNQPINVSFKPQPIEPSASIDRGQLNKSNQDINRLTLPQPSPLEKSGIKLNLGNEFAPPVGTPPKTSFKSAVRKAASGVGNLLKKLNPFK